jgi:tRNA-specific 2-thiouridylase
MALLRNRQLFREGSRGCCSLEDANDARRAADTIGIPFYVWDLSENFQETVVDDFLAEYARGRTPNPCVRCNEHVKFTTLTARAEALGFDAVVTGHYARIVASSQGPELHRAANHDKDQSYVLAVMGPQQLSRVVLPLGEYSTKAQVRAEADRRGLGVSHKPDSYDICFIPDGNTAGFLRERLGDQPGLIVDPEGTPLGGHSGAYQFTVGQRKGLNLHRPAPDGRPRYVLDVDTTTRTVVAGPEELLTVDHMTLTDMVTYGDIPYDAALTVQVRAHGAPVPATITPQDPSKLRVTLTQGTLRGVAAGQSAVVYHGTRVMAQGTIAHAARVPGN